MALTEIGKAGSWTEAFAKAKGLLVEEKLTAVAVVFEAEYATGRYVATHLEEFSRVMGCVDAVLDNLELVSPILYKRATTFRMMHGIVNCGHPMLTGDGWMFVIVWDNK